ncbi:MAG TPA: hypothetical protein DCP20_11210 [Coriobacteriia bacterium]|nr:MAG: hypothetical protein XD74_1600 [Actinobacteria bacterium 66_15]HAL31258.1 hypothetical protein [Coriobacteriia bacterium]
MKPVSDVVALLAALGAVAFFAGSAIVGYRYSGSEASPVFGVYSLAVAASALLLVVYGLVLQRRRYSALAWMSGLLPILVCVSFFAAANGTVEDAAAWPTFRNFLVWAAPALYAGLHVGTCGSWRRIRRLLDPLMVFLSMASIASVARFLVDGWSARGIAGASYQTLSYVSALAFGLNLYMLLNFEGYERFRFARSGAFRSFGIALLPLQVFAAVVSGGRGGVVLIGVYVVLYVLLKLRSSRGRAQSVLVLVTAGLLTVATLQLALPNTLVSQGYDRAFAYVSSSGIDWSGTSGRDAVYSSALSLIDERPVFGYGPFGFVEHLSPYVYPHNLFLELVLAGGVIGFTGAMLAAGLLTHRYFILKRRDPTYGGLGVLVTYQLVMLMFSGTYLAAPTLWFAFGVIVGAPRVKSRLLADSLALTGIEGEALE